MATDRFPFAFDRRFSVPLRLLGVRPGTAGVSVSNTSVRIAFGPLKVQTPLSNVAGVEVSGDYRWFRAIGPRLSLADRGVTFGTNAEAGACIRLHEPVPALLGQRLPHPGFTVTVAEPAALKAAIDVRLGA